MRHSRYKKVGQSPAVKRGLLAHVAPFWPAIQKAAAASLKQKPSGFLPPPDQRSLLGAGFWGCVWPTADKRFVIKASVDLTEGPHVALAMKLFPKHPGMAYYHRIWRLPQRVWTNEQGYSWVWIMLREETDVDSIWRGVSPAPGYRKIHAGLDALPECCGCLHQERALARQTCDGQDVQLAEHELAKILKQVGSPASSKGKYVASLIGDAYKKHGILLGDVHFGNVGLRRHDLSKFGVKRHRDLVVTDLGDLGQAPRGMGGYPDVPEIRKNPGLYQRLFDEIPVLRP